VLTEWEISRRSVMASHGSRAVFCTSHNVNDGIGMGIAVFSPGLLGTGFDSDHAWVPASGAALVTKPKNRRVFKKNTRTGAAATVRVSGSPGNEFVYYRDESQEVR
jgi:hypothetical protein